MANIKITTGDLEVLDSGIVRNGLTNNLKFDLNGLWVDFIFIVDDSGSRVDYIPSDDSKGLIVKIFNCVKGGVSGVYQPIRIGSFEGRELWLAFSVTKPFDKYNSWILEYSFYIGGSVDE